MVQYFFTTLININLRNGYDPAPWQYFPSFKQYCLMWPGPQWH